MKGKYCTDFHVSALTETAFNATQETDPQGPKNKALWHYAELALGGHREHAQAMLLAFQALAEASITPPPAMLAYLARAVITHNEEGVSVDTALGLARKKSSEGLKATRAAAVVCAVHTAGGDSLERAADILEAKKHLFPSVRKPGEMEPLTAPAIKAIYREAKKTYRPWNGIY